MSNVIFSDTRKTISIELPSYPGSEVIMYDGLLFHQIDKLQKMKEDDVDKGILTLQFMIKDWNFTNEAGEKLPITIENLGNFPIADVTLLSKTVSDFFPKETEEKKKSSKI